MVEGLNKCAVLVVEDDSFIGDVVTSQLGSKGFMVKRVATGEMGVETIKKELPSIVLLDIGLPGIDGYEVLKQIKSDPGTKEIKVLVLSNFGQADEVARSKELGAIDHLVKANVDPHVISDRVKELCGT